MPDIAIIVHGGAKEIPHEQHRAHRAGCLRAVEAGWAVLEHGGTAAEAVEAAIRVMEDDPTFNAGYGSELNAEGEVQMDAALMEGKELQAGGVAFVRTVRSPISVAYRLLGDEDVLLVGEGAERYAAEQGLETCANEQLITEERRREWEERAGRRSASRANNTVGCVAMDSDGNLAAGASTGGLGGDRRGRVGDSPQVGAGIYADNESGGCSWSGDGERISRCVLAKASIDLLGELSPDEAANRAVATLRRRVQGEGGCILMSRSGRIGWGHNSCHMAVGYRTAGMREPRAFLQKAEEEGAR